MNSSHEEMSHIQRTLFLLGTVVNWTYGMWCHSLEKQRDVSSCPSGFWEFCRESCYNLCWGWANRGKAVIRYKYSQKPWKWCRWQNVAQRFGTNKKRWTCFTHHFFLVPYTLIKHTSMMQRLYKTFFLERDVEAHLGLHGIKSTLNSLPWLKWVIIMLLFLLLSCGIRAF